MNTLAAAACALLSSPALLAADPPAAEPYFGPVHGNTTRLITQLIRDEHPQRLQPGEPPARQVFEHYLLELDPERLFFLRADIELFLSDPGAVNKTLDADAHILTPRIFERFRRRVAEGVATALAVLESPLPAATENSSNGTDNLRSWARDADQISGRWRARIAADARLLTQAGRSEEEIAPILRRRYEQMRSRIHSQPKDEVYRGFINAYLSRIDPHSGFFLPRRPRGAERDLQGIGVRLKPQGEHTVIRRLFAGGAADRSRQIQLGDRIVAVGEGRRKPLTDVVSWPIAEVVDLIRGPRGSLVRLQILPHLKSRTHTVTLTRDRIDLEETRARKTIVETENQRRIGVISIPSFYLDYAAFGRARTKARSTSGDVETLILELNQEQIDGIIIDLRGNRGGDLFEAVRVTGLFIPGGPVVQVRDGNGDVELQRDTDPRLVYGGPLAVLVNRASASASEIFAGAIADYRRGLILGEATFGKGTVQRTFNLNYAAGENTTFGQLVLTVAQYYRVSGDSTQLRGVTPDLSFPTTPGAAQFNEGLEDAPLPWGRIDAARFEPLDSTIESSLLRQRHEQRIADDPRWRALGEAPTDMNDPDLGRRWRALILEEAASVLADAIELAAMKPAERKPSAIIRAPSNLSKPRP